MPPRKKIDRESIVDAAFAVTERDGWSGVSARSVAKELGVSTQPIYSEFGSMEELKSAVVVRGFMQYILFEKEYCEKAAAESPSPAYQAVAYVRFSAEHPNLFKLLYMDKTMVYGSLDDTAHKLLGETGIIENLKKATGLDGEEVYKLHFAVWMAMHGLASIAAYNTVEWTDAELKQFALTISSAMKRFYKEKQ